MGVPPVIMHFSGIFHKTSSILGYPHFRKPPYQSCWFSKIKHLPLSITFLQSCGSMGCCVDNKVPAFIQGCVRTKGSKLEKRKAKAHDLRQFLGKTAGADGRDLPCSGEREQQNQDVDGKNSLQAGASSKSCQNCLHEQRDVKSVEICGKHMRMITLDVCASANYLTFEVIH